MTVDAKQIYMALGWYFHRKYQRRMQDSGAFAAATQLRKQGVDIRVARLLVAYRPIPVLTHGVPKINLVLGNAR